MVGVFGIAGLAMAMQTAAGAGVVFEGAVKKPGILAVSRPQSLHETVRQMGGFRPEADVRHVRVHRKDGPMKVVDMTQLGIVPSVQPGDRVEVPTIDPTHSVLVQGGVAHAGAYDFRPGMTVRELVRSANPAEKASLEKVRIYRPDKNGTVQVHTANLMAMNLDAEALRAGDTVYVPRASVSMSDRELITILVVGLVLIVLLD